LNWLRWTLLMSAWVAAVSVTVACVSHVDRDEVRPKSTPKAALGGH
jgi:hypothetical protein